jgi:hypothetical protein
MSNAILVQKRWTYRIIPDSFPLEGSNDGFSCWSLFIISPYIKHTNPNKSRAYTDSRLRYGLSVFTNTVRKTQDKPYSYNKCPLHGCRGKNSNTQGYCMAISKSVTCTNITPDIHAYMHSRTSIRDYRSSLSTDITSETVVFSRNRSPWCSSQAFDPQTERAHSLILFLLFPVYYGK